MILNFSLFSWSDKTVYVEEWPVMAHYIFQTIDELKWSTGAMKIDREKLNARRKACLSANVFTTSPTWTVLY
jgi:hypothetical protein